MSRNKSTPTHGTKDAEDSNDDSASQVEPTVVENKAPKSSKATSASEKKDVPKKDDDPNDNFKDEPKTRKNRGKPSNKYAEFTELPGAKTITKGAKLPKVPIVAAVTPTAKKGGKGSVAQTSPPVSTLPPLPSGTVPPHPGASFIPSLPAPKKRGRPKTNLVEDTALNNATKVSGMDAAAYIRHMKGLYQGSDIS